MMVFNLGTISILDILWKETKKFCVSIVAQMAARPANKKMVLSSHTLLGKDKFEQCILMNFFRGRWTTLYLLIDKLALVP